MSPNTLADLQRALEGLGAEEPAVDATAALASLRRRHQRSRFRRATVAAVAGAAAVVGVVAGVAWLRPGGDGAGVVATATPAPDGPAGGLVTKDVPELPRDADQEVFLRPAASAGDVAAVRDALLADPRVLAFHYLDHQAAYERFGELFREQNPPLIAFTTPDALPTSFLVLLADGADEAAFVADIRAAPSVFDVIDPHDVPERAAR